MQRGARCVLAAGAASTRCTAKAVAWMHGVVAAWDLLRSHSRCIRHPFALQKSLHGCTGSLRRRTHCIPAAGTHCTPNIVAWAHGGAAARDSLHPSSRCCSHTLHHKSCCMGVWCRLIAGLVAFQQPLHTKSCCMDAQCHCSTAPTASQYPLHPNTHCIPVPTAAGTRCTPTPAAPSIHCIPKVVAQMCGVIAAQHPLHPAPVAWPRCCSAPTTTASHCMAVLLCCKPATVASQHLLHGCAVALQPSTHCTQHPLHTCTHFMAVVLHGTHCTQHPLHSAPTVLLHCNPTPLTSQHPFLACAVALQ